MELLVLPDADSKKLRTERQKWAFFRHWPEGAYRFDWISPHVVPGFSRLVESRVFKAFVLQSLLAFVRERHYDAVVAHGSRSIAVLALLHRLLGRRRPKLLVFDIEAFGRSRSGPKLWLMRRASEALDGVIFHAHAQKSYYHEFLPALEGKTHFVKLGFGMPRKQLSWEQTSRGDFILSLGTAAPNRREWRVLVEALAMLGEHPPVRIVGGADFGGTPPDGVELLPRMPITDLRRLMEECAFAVLPLTERGHAHGQLTLLDLMAAGAPVVVSETSGVREYVREDIAVLYSVGDARALAEGLRWALDHPEERRALGRRAHDAVERDFSPEEFSKTVYHIVRGVLEDAPAPPPSSTEPG